MRAIVAFGLLFTAAGLAWASLEQARAEPNLERRSALAMDNAKAALKEAREAYNSGDLRLVAGKLAEIQESVEFAYQSLVGTKKDPRKSPKWFKRAEIESRDLLRSMDTLQHDMSFEDRGMLDKIRETVQRVHDDLLTGLMEGRRR
jgi:hypothetical protein